MPVGANIVRPRNCAVATALHGGLRAGRPTPDLPVTCRAGCPHPAENFAVPQRSRVVEDADPYRRGGFHIRPQHLAADIPFCEPMQASAPTGIFSIYMAIEKSAR